MAHTSYGFEAKLPLPHHFVDTRPRRSLIGNPTDWDSRPAGLGDGLQSPNTQESLKIRDGS